MHHHSNPYPFSCCVPAVALLALLFHTFFFCLVCLLSPLSFLLLQTILSTQYTTPYPLLLVINNHTLVLWPVPTLLHSVRPSRTSAAQPPSSPPYTSPLVCTFVTLLIHPPPNQYSYTTHTPSPLLIHTTPIHYALSFQSCSSVARSLSSLRGLGSTTSAPMATKWSIWSW